ncbi:MAG: 23S rRNA (guanosine(2251)-2'-O)-methyltransferase RlmB [Ignavibacteriaceae bacterium]|nr:23S rRNA (guanosine(2251)-2'-O)-methyltransferase RlmB [Ignavibacteriaceae bacterium]
MKEQLFIGGRKPAIEYLESGKSVIRVLVQEGIKDNFISKITAIANKRGIPVKFLPKLKLDLLKKSEISQGVILEVPGFEFTGIDTLIQRSLNRNKLIVILDSIQDPQNLGAILRTSECAGADGVIITKHNSSPVNETVIKTSAGAISHIPVVESVNLSNSIKMLKDAGFWIIGTHLEVNPSKTKIDFNLPLAVILGNEEKGIRRLIKDECDFLVKIPMGGKIDSLNVSVTAGVILYSILAKRGFEVI